MKEPWWKYEVYQEKTEYGFAQEAAFSKGIR